MSRIIHVYGDWNRKAGDHRRHKDAAASWPRAFRGVEYVQVAVHEESLKRNAKTVLGDGKPLPFLKDLIDAGIERGQGKPSDTLLWSNDDSSFAEGSSPLIEGGMGWASRRDFISVPRRLTQEAVAKGQHHMGADAFWFPIREWPSLRRELPDFVMCREAFDIVFKRVIFEQGGREIANILAHAMHTAEWTTAWDHPSSKHNNKLGADYAESKGVELKFL